MNIELIVKCIYVVNREFDNVPDKIAKSLIDMDEITEGSEVYDWLSDHVKEEDAVDWDFILVNANKTEGGE